MPKVNPPDNEIIKIMSHYITLGKPRQLKIYLQSLTFPLSEAVVLKKYEQNYNLVSFAYLFGLDLISEVIRLTSQTVFDKACIAAVIDNNTPLMHTLFVIAHQSAGHFVRAEKILEHMSAKAIGIGAQIQFRGAATPLSAALFFNNEHLICLFLQKLLPEDLNRAAAFCGNKLGNILHIVIKVNSSQKVIDLLMSKLHQELAINLLAMKNSEGKIPFDYAVPENEERLLHAPSGSLINNQAAGHVLKHIAVKELPRIIAQSKYGESGFMRKIKLYNSLLFNQVREMQVATRSLRAGSLDEHDLGAEIQASSVENLRFLVAANPIVATSVIKPEYPQFSLTGISSLWNPVVRWSGRHEISLKLEEAHERNQIESAELSEVFSFFTQHAHQFPYEVVLLIFSYQVKPFMIELTTPHLHSNTLSPRM